MIAPLVSSNSSLLNPTFISLESVLKLQYMFFLLNILQILITVPVILNVLSR
jgi:hypothetical protein